MKTTLVVAGLLALASALTPPGNQSKISTKSVDPHFIVCQRKILLLFQFIQNVDKNADYYKVGFKYDIKANIDNYSNKSAVEDFLKLKKTGFLPIYYEFSIFYKRMRDEAIALFNLFICAKNFDTFYKTAAFARVHLNRGLFLYAIHVAVHQRKDTCGFVLPAPYVVFPQLFTNWDTQWKIIRTKMVDGLNDPALEAEHGILLEENVYVFYSNYSNSLTYPDEEQRLSYLTEDIGWNSYYYHFHSLFPFWWNSNKFSIPKERLGELLCSFYQKLLARYKLDRSTNGLGRIPKFSWHSSINTGYSPALTSKATPFAQRNEFFNIYTEKNYEKVGYLDAYEKTFIHFLQLGYFKACGDDIHFRNQSNQAVDFAGNYWQGTADLCELTTSQDYQRSSEAIARRVLGAAPKPIDKYNFVPSAFDFHQTSLRDPAFYQLYNRIFSYITRFKERLVPYSVEKLHFPGVKVDDVIVEDLTTVFEQYDFEANNMIFYNQDQLNANSRKYRVRQPRINHKPFTVPIEIRSEVRIDAVIKIFIAPKYDPTHISINVGDMWDDFFELDRLVQQLTPGLNSIVRKSESFTNFKDDSVPLTEIFKLLDEGKIPSDMSDKFSLLPRRLMLPKGDGLFQMLVCVYPVFPDSELEPFGYPLDRPAKDSSFRQPNFFFKDVFIKHEGEKLANKYNIIPNVVLSNLRPVINLL